VSIRPSARSSRYSGGTIAICGNIDTASTQARSARRPGKRSRASAYAEAAPRLTHTTVVAAATTSEWPIACNKSR
jgi:hypothetical protein